MVAAAVARLDADQFWAEVHAAYDRLRADPKEWDGYLSEAREWDVTLLDGLEHEPPPTVRARNHTRKGEACLALPPSRWFVSRTWAVGDRARHASPLHRGFRRYSPHTPLAAVETRLRRILNL